jgi:hypothetical protein
MDVSVEYDKETCDLLIQFVWRHEDWAKIGEASIQGDRESMRNLKDVLNLAINKMLKKFH